MGILLSHYLAFLFSNMYSVGVCIFHYKLRKIGSIIEVTCKLMDRSQQMDKHLDIIV